MSAINQERGNELLLRAQARVAELEEKMTEAQAMLNTPMSPEEREIATEVFNQYGGIDRVAAWVALRNRALETSRPFRSYDCAHAIASSLRRSKLEQGL